MHWNPALKGLLITWTKFAQISSQSEMSGDDVDLLFLGTSPGKPSSLSRLWPRKNKNPLVFSASPVASAGGINSPHRLSCSTVALTFLLLGWRTWQGSPLRPPSWRGKNEPQSERGVGGLLLPKVLELSTVWQCRKLGTSPFKIRGQKQKPLRLSIVKPSCSQTVGFLFLAVYRNIRLQKVCETHDQNCHSSVFVNGWNC